MQKVDLVAKLLCFYKETYPLFFEICHIDLKMKLFDWADTKNKKLTS